MAKSIAVAGKGGIGKSTIAALVVLGLKAAGERPILAVDADPDSNLATLLGVEAEESVADLREEVRNNVQSFPAGMSKAAYVEAGLHEAIAEAEGFDIITMGRGEGSGCYCYLNSLIRKFSDDLTPSYKWVVFDNEAGLEHLSRRTTENVDALLVVVTENPLSLHSAKKIMEITTSLKSRIARTYAVTNMVKPRNLATVHERLRSIGLEVLVDVPYDEDLEQVVFDTTYIATPERLAVWEPIKTIITTVGGSNGAA